MSRRFAISCFGSVNAQPLDQKKIQTHCVGLLTSDEVQQVYESAPTNGRWLFFPMGNTLTLVRKVNKKLHELGIETVVHVFEQGHPESIKVFEDQRQGTRRGSPLGVAANIERRVGKNRGRRQEDQ